MKKLILIELNEINFDLIKIYSKKKKFNFFNDDFLSNLRITSSENIYKKIEPWIQWVSIHTGKTADEHKIERLGDINKLDSKQIFERVEELGYSVGAICPMGHIAPTEYPNSSTLSNICLLSNLLISPNLSILCSSAVLPVCIETHCIQGSIFL